MLKSLTFWVFVGALAGCLLAVAFGEHRWTNMPDPPLLYQLVLLAKTAFLQMLRMLIAPLIFFSLIGGLISIGSVVRLKQLGGVTIAYYLCTTAIAICIGLIAVFYIHPWTAYPGGANSLLTATMQQDSLTIIATKTDSVAALIGHLLQLAFVNPFAALVELNIVGIVTNAILIGLAMVLILPQESPLITLVDHINRVMGKLLNWVILSLPVGIFAIIFDFTLKLSGGSGAAGDILKQLISFGFLVVSITLVHGIVVLPALAFLLAGITPIALFRKTLRPLFVAFSTSSSSATLPVSMKTCEEELHISRAVTSFVLPLGATMNMDGTALFEAIAAIFLAYIYGIDLSMVAIISIFFMTMIASIGAPGMPSASMAGMQMILLAVGIPLEAIGLLLVIERPLDAIRTAVNVEGDLVGAAVVQNYLNKKRRKSAADLDFKEAA